MTRNADRAPRQPADQREPHPAVSHGPRGWWDLEGVRLPYADYQGTPGEHGSREPGLVHAFHAIAEPVAGVVGPMADAIGTVLGAAGDALAGPAATRVKRLRRLNREPLANLFELHPEARRAAPRELGLRFVPIGEIRGTAVAGAAQRGGDFLPLRPFRGVNWQSRWDRIREANRRLQALPPVDLLKYGGEYWVLDGHNRVAMALYSNGVGLDAMVVELVPIDGRASERPTGLLSMLGDAGAVRAAGLGLSPAMSLRQSELAAERPSDAEHRSGDGSPADDGSPAGGEADRP